MPWLDGAGQKQQGAPEEQRVGKVVHADVNIAGMRGENGGYTRAITTHTTIPRIVVATRARQLASIASPVATSTAPTPCANRSPGLCRRGDGELPSTSSAEARI